MVNINNPLIFGINLIPDTKKSGIASWQYTVLLPHLITLVITTLIIMILCVSYYKGLKKTESLDTPNGLVLFVEITIKWIERQIIDLMGPKYKFLTVYVIYLLLYIGISNLLAIIGLEPITTAYTVPLSMGIVTFIGIYYFGIKYQKLFYFKKFINPIELLTQFVPLISISFRLFGNVLGGTIIMSLLTTLLGKIWSYIPYVGQVNLLAGIILPFLSLYFDIFDGLIQAYIFSILTISYWSMAMTSGEKIGKDKKRKEIIIKIEKEKIINENI